jgi:hypothetical protein
MNFGNAKIEYLQRKGAIGALGQKKVTRFDVPMDNTRGMRFLKATQCLHRYSQRSPQRQGANSIEPVLQIIAVKQLGDEVNVPSAAARSSIQDADDVVAFDASRGLGLAPKSSRSFALGEMFVQDLDGNMLARVLAMSFVDDPHAPLAEPRDELVPAIQDLADHADAP